MTPTTPLNLYSCGEVKKYKTPTTKAIGHSVQKVTLKCANKMLSEERRKTQWEKTPLMMNIEEVTDHPNELTPKSEWK